ncbi:MAG: hypothetical protein RIC55_08315 [Pirellulaceae bacterium]
MLRTADDTAGKQAKCPECDGLSPVPTRADDSSPAADAPFTWQPGATSTAAAHEPKPIIDPTNPYASPVGASQEAGGYALPSDAAELKRGYLEFGRVTSITWSAASAQMGMGVLFALIVIGISLAMALIIVPLSLAQEEMLDNGQLFAALGLVVGVQFVEIPFNALMFCIMINFGLNILRPKREPFERLFEIGHAFVPVMGFNLVFFGIWLLCFGPGQALTIYANAVGREPALAAAGSVASLIGAVVHLIIWLNYMLTPALIVDRRLPLFVAMETSGRFMKGNKGTAFLIFLVVGILGGLFVIITCAIGSLFVIPYYAVLIVTMYLTATGQFSHGTSPKQGASPYA